MRLDDLQTFSAARWLFLESEQRWIIAAAEFLAINPPHMTGYRSEVMWTSLVLRGRGTYTDPGGRTHALGPGSLIQRFPRQRHSSWYDPDGGYVGLYWGTDAKTSAHLIDTGFVSAEPVLSIELDQGVIEEFKHLCRLITTPEAEHDSRLLLFDYMGFLRSIYLRARRKHVRGRWDRTLAEAQTLIEHDLEGRLSVETIARRLDVSYSSLRAEFRSAMGISLAAYRIRKRMEAAQRLLLNHPVSQVARTLGYGDPAVFSRQFKKHFGLAPAHFQRERTS